VSGDQISIRAADSAASKLTPLCLVMMVVRLTHLGDSYILAISQHWSLTPYMDAAAPD